MTSNAFKILADVEAVGGRIELMPPDGLRVSAPRALVEQVKAHKPDIIRALRSVPLSSFDHEAFEERTAIIESNGIPRAWAEGYAVLCTMPRPAPYAPDRWQQLVDDGGYFLDAWARQTAALGWNSTDCFGVHPDAPEARYDGMGLIPILNGKRVVAVTASTARINCGKGIFQTYHRQQTSGAIAIWQLLSS